MSTTLNLCGLICLRTDRVPVILLVLLCQKVYQLEKAADRFRVADGNRPQVEAQHCGFAAFCVWICGWGGLRG